MLLDLGPAVTSLDHMLYAILCYNQEDLVDAWPKAEDDAVMAKLAAVEDKLARQGRLGPVARLRNTRTAATLRKGEDGPPQLLDGPFAETKEQLLGFFIVDCENLEAAVEAARELAEANPGTGSYEIRPLRVFKPSVIGGQAGGPPPP
jgi:hypothetical protein